MKTIFFVFLLTVCPLRNMSFTPRTGIQSRPDQEAQSAKLIHYRLDVDKSKLYWSASKMMGGGHNGYLLFYLGGLTTSSTGEIQKGIFALNMNSITTTDELLPSANKQVDKVLKATDFFAVNQFPSAEIQITSVVSTRIANQFAVSGNLTLKGITKPIQFIAKIISDSDNIKATAEFEIDRTEWGITYKSGSLLSRVRDELISDTIKISLDLSFYKTKEPVRLVQQFC